MTRINWKWIIENGTIVKVKVEATLDFRKQCVDQNGQKYVVSKYDIYDTLTKAKAALDEDLPS